MAQWVSAPATSAEDECGSQHLHGSVRTSVVTSSLWDLYPLLAFVDHRHAGGTYTYTQANTHAQENK